MNNYDLVVGLEIHSELKTNTKAFCGCRNKFGSQPNTNCCPVCIGAPGALPVLNKKALEYAIMSGLALDCKISNYTVFERKNYFYPDLSKGYQISQLEHPLCINGKLDIKTNDNTEKTIRINRVHMEEDSGKNIHDNISNTSLIDYNRSSVPLIEIVTEPDISSSDEAVAFLEKIKESLVYIGVTDGKMQEGSLRCDINVSLKPKGSKNLGNRTEMKNLNSFKAVKRAIDTEAKRQAELLDKGENIPQETRRWDDLEGESYSLRSKETSQDYRYFPDPDLIPIKVTDEYVQSIKENMVELPSTRRQRYINKLGLPKYDAKVLTDRIDVSDFFESCLKILNKPKNVSNFIMSNVLRLLKEDEQEFDEKDVQIKIEPKQLCDIIMMLENEEINSTSAKTIFEKVWQDEGQPKELVDKLNLRQNNNTSELEGIIKEIVDSNPQVVSDYLKTKNDRVLKFFIGQVMKQTKGSANPKVATDLIKQYISDKKES